MNRLLAIALKELRQVRRDPLTLAMMVALPVLQLLLFGYAINTDIRHVPTVVLDDDHSAASRGFAQRLQATGFHDIVGAVADHDEFAHALRRSDARVGIVFPPDYEEDLVRGRTARIQLIVDGSDPQIVASATNAVMGLAERIGATIQLERLGPQAAPALEVRPTTWYNPELRTAVFVVPGIIGVILTMTMVMLTSMAIARERERGTLEALIVSPVRPIELMLGKIVPYVAIGYVQVTLILLVGYAIFRVPFRGSLVLLYALTFLFIAANLALGLVFSTMAKTQQQAMQMSFFFLLPNILLSGFAFPWEGMPPPAQWLSLGLPLTHFLRIVRGITLKGATFADLAHELVWLIGILVAFIAAASLRFRKKLV